MLPELRPETRHRVPAEGTDQFFSLVLFRRHKVAGRLRGARFLASRNRTRAERQFKRDPLFLVARFLRIGRKKCAKRVVFLFSRPSKRPVKSGGIRADGADTKNTLARAKRALSERRLARERRAKRAGNDFSSPAAERVILVARNFKCARRIEMSRFLIIEASRLFRSCAPVPCLSRYRPTTRLFQGGDRTVFAVVNVSDARLRADLCRDRQQTRVPTRRY